MECARLQIRLYGLRIAVLYVDAGYDTYRFVAFVRALGIVPVIDYNLRRLGKRFLATLFFLDQWRRLRAARGAVERCFAFLKRYYGLKYFQVQGRADVHAVKLLLGSRANVLLCR